MSSLRDVDGRGALCCKALSSCLLKEVTPVGTDSMDQDTEVLNGPHMPYQVQLIANAAESQAVFGGAEGPSVPRGFLTPFKE